MEARSSDRYPGSPCGCGSPAYRRAILTRPARTRIAGAPRSAVTRPARPGIGGTPGAVVSRTAGSGIARPAGTVIVRTPWTIVALSARTARTGATRSGIGRATGAIVGRTARAGIAGSAGTGVTLAVADVAEPWRMTRMRLAPGPSTGNGSSSCLLRRQTACRCRSYQITLAQAHEMRLTVPE